MCKGYNVCVFLWVCNCCESRYIYYICNYIGIMISIGRGVDIFV